MSDSTSKSVTPTDANGLTRRTAMKRVLLTAAGLAVGWTAVRARPAEAAGSVPKGAVGYQDKPNGNERCLTCSQFIPGKTADAMGTCNVVAGAISPDGWCNVWAAKG